LIQTRDGPEHRPAVIGVELHNHSNGEPSKLSETLGGTQKLQTLDDAPVQFDEFIFGQRREVWEHGAGAVYHPDRRHSVSAALPMTKRFNPFANRRRGKGRSSIGIVWRCRP
jgi:hypothetical protein